MGYQNALTKAGLTYNPELIIKGNFSADSGLSAANKFADMMPRPSAIFCMNDKMAIGLIQGLKAKGIKVPEDISVAGFDDIEFAKYSDPPLTTIRQPAIELGSCAMALLCDLIEGNVDESTVLQPHFLATDLIVRGSTGVANSE